MKASLMASGSDSAPGLSQYFKLSRPQQCRIGQILDVVIGDIGGGGIGSGIGGSTGYDGVGSLYIGGDDVQIVLFVRLELAVVFILDLIGDNV
ncbi:hypothetical protein NDU88_004403 [Pleurodeles waltl]|uniref:Uncharacterized protein n=1 Tax=Pleurodeles waltl TaxID=8319 RepID=A0AAV7SIQ8_PLEWA|nr:hypothetical protein NDU88_004403 [Pleurodeles waltl]